ncbi:hypothetical protein [uncultured Gimesia sp.]|uniref:hypothetical protein n=1 Tax=uncultured Gimesia sp. TaxID=1678688 RepID=UPI0026379F3F|nr:hypothetical protein [uncultured Gimesia sp.]
MNQPDHQQHRLKLKSSRWTIWIVVFLVLYFVLQSQQEQKIPPNQQAELVQKDKSISTSGKPTGAKALPASNETIHQTQIKKNKGSLKPGLKQQADSGTSQKKTQSVTTSPAKVKRTPANSNRPPPADSSKSTAKSKPELGQLRELGGKVWESVAGLRYGPGSQEKHRLLHIMRHAEDQPNRPGKHGVFLGDGDRKKILALIDEAYLKALKGGRKVAKKQEGNRVVYTVDMGRRIGFVGGKVGNKQGKPAASKIRLVLEGTNVITAFPL